MEWEDYFIKPLAELSPYQQGLQKKDARNISKALRLHKLSSNESVYGPFPSAIAAISRASFKLAEYCDGSGRELKDALSSYYGVNTENIALGNGSVELIYFIAQSCLKKNDEIVSIWPSFITYETVATLAKAKLVKVMPREDGSFSLKKVLKSITNKTKMVVLCNPNNPTGTVVSKEEFDKFYKDLPKDVLLLIDEAYIEFTEEGSTFDSLKYFNEKGNIVILRTFSKMFGLAGLRCGYCFAAKELIQAIDKIRQPFNVNTLAQKAATASIKDVNTLKSRQAKSLQDRNYMLSQLDNFTMELAIKLDCLVSDLCPGGNGPLFYYYKTQANFVFICLENSEQLNKKLLEKGVICRVFRSGIRITVGGKSSTDAFIKALRQFYFK